LKYNLLKYRKKIPPAKYSSRVTLDLSQSQRLQIAAAAQWLCPADHDQFWAAIAAELEGREGK
jgi:hypothetical protein